MKSRPFASYPAASASPPNMLREGQWGLDKLFYIKKKTVHLAFVGLKDTDQVLWEKMKETTSSVTIHAADIISTSIYRGL